jgi:exopolysaccharide biosynthesis polyprenyl glycosylphosphotransferase
MTPNLGDKLAPVGADLKSPPAVSADKGPRISSGRIPLQRHGRQNARRHLLSPMLRWSVLLAGDLLLFLLLNSAAQTLPPIYHFPGGSQLAIALVLGLIVTGTYGPGDPRRDPARLFGGCALAAAVTLWHPLWQVGLWPVFVQFVLLVVVLWVGLIAERTLVDRLVHAYRVDRAGTGFAILVGRPEACNAPHVTRLMAPGGEFVAVGYVDTSAVPRSDSLGGIERFGEILEHSGADTVILCEDLPDLMAIAVVDQILCAQCRLLSSSRLVQVPGLKPGLVWHGGWPVIELTAPTLTAWNLLVKRVMDVTLAAIGLVVLAPVFLLVAIAIKLDSPGPVFFRQRRVGQAGRLFDILKFRSMRVDAEQALVGLQEQSIYSDPRLFKIPKDPRVTSLGRWLRRTSIDELPQLYNVLKGDMSLVGPRPPLPSEVALYEEHHFFRFDMRPGITGPWQVSGRNLVTLFDEVIRLEGEYVRNWHPGLDLSILLRTIPVVLRMRGAL